MTAVEPGGKDGVGLVHEEHGAGPGRLAEEARIAAERLRAIATISKTFFIFCRFRLCSVMSNKFITALLF